MYFTTRTYDRDSVGFIVWNEIEQIACKSNMQTTIIWVCIPLYYIGAMKKIILLAFRMCSYLDNYALGGYNYSRFSSASVKMSFHAHTLKFDVN